jgi:hypothetical protein
MLLAFHYTDNYKKASQRYVIRSLRVLCAILVLPVRAAGIPSTSCLEYPVFELPLAVSPLRLENVEIAPSITFDILLFCAENKMCVPAQ